LDGWATPGANLHAAALELARTAARRAERRLAGLPAHGRTVRPLLGQYLNRASDFLWLLARQAEM
jgi:cob(I)alamin adenosyltransferase